MHIYTAYRKAVDNKEGNLPEQFHCNGNLYDVHSIVHNNYLHIYAANITDPMECEKLEIIDCNGVICWSVEN